MAYPLLSSLGCVAITPFSTVSGSLRFPGLRVTPFSGSLRFPDDFEPLRLLGFLQEDKHENGDVFFAPFSFISLGAILVASLINYPKQITIIIPYFSAFSATQFS